MSDQPSRDEFLGRPPPDKTYQAELAQPETRRPQQSWATWFFVLFMIAVVVGPVVQFWLPGEIARWHQAAVFEQSLNGDLEAAIESLNHTIKDYPDQATLYIQRADWYRQLGEYQAALKDCNRAAELAPSNFRVYELRSQVHQHLGDFDQGIEDFKKVLELSEKGRPSLRPGALNGLAYARALANTELEKALEEVEEVLSMPSVQQDAAVLDTRGYIHYLRQDYKAAREDLERAVSQMEATHAQKVKELNGEHPGVWDLRIGRQNLKRLEQSLAVIRYHRGLLYEALKMKAQAKQDFDRVRELGYEPTDALF